MIFGKWLLVFKEWCGKGVMWVVEVFKEYGEDFVVVVNFEDFVVGMNCIIFEILLLFELICIKIEVCDV